jgi:hypothetical protein
VQYRGKLFYFQPFESECYLYDQVGRPRVRAYRTAKTQVYPPNEDEIVRFLSCPRERRQIKEIE